MMSKDEILKYKKFQEDGFEIVSKPMKNTRFSFIILLPLEKWNLNGAIEVLNGNKILSHYVDKLEETSVSLKMPKFTLTKKLQLVGTLKSIGISSKNNLYVNSFIQTNVMKVNESGIEAASVTSPIIVPISALIPDVNFHVTHPFICFIYDQQLTMPLLAAKVINPML
ncbi:Alpha-2-antiplasmin [Schistosoma japonicum]|nr:Alpha-2-antiplasmin [Schistosoma japonicum]